MTASMQTRIAQDAARDAEAEWKRHAAGCHACNRVIRARQGAEPCAEGAGLRNEATRLKKAAKHEADLDKEPNPDQEALF